MSDERCDLLCLDLRRADVGHHLRVLREAGLAHSRREGKIIFYALTPMGARLLDTLLTAEADTASR